jgi:branched-chain amino acid transport system substrate-binding protein
MSTSNSRWGAALAAALIAGLPLGAAGADTIKIGLVTEITGPNAESGTYSVNGAKLALDEINAAGGVNGRQLELKVSDSQSTNPGAVLALSKMASEGGYAAFIGPVRSTQIQAMAPTIMKAGIPMMIGGTDPGLTHSNDRWVFRCRPNDAYSAKVIAEYGTKTLGHKKWAIIHATDAFGTGGKNALMDALKERGVTPALVQGFTSNTQDFTPIILAIKQSGADIVATYIPNSPDVGIFAKQLRQLGISADWIGSPSVVTETALKLGQEALYGTFSVTDFTPGANPEATAYAQKYKQRFGVEPDFYSSWTYDAMKLVAEAIRKANGSTKPDELRSAILATQGYHGVEGTYAFDPNGDGLHGYNVVKNEKGKVTFITRIDFPPGQQATPGGTASGGK